MHGFQKGALKSSMYFKHVLKPSCMAQYVHVATLEAAKTKLTSKSHIVGNHVSQLIFLFHFLFFLDEVNWPFHVLR